MSSFIYKFRTNWIFLYSHFFKITHLSHVLTIIVIVTIISLPQADFEDLRFSRAQILFSLYEGSIDFQLIYSSNTRKCSRKRHAFLLKHTDGDLRRGITIWRDIGLHDVITRQTRARRFVKLRADVSFIPELNVALWEVLYSVSKRW